MTVEIPDGLLHGGAGFALGLLCFAVDAWVARRRARDGRPRGVRGRT